MIKDILYVNKDILCVVLDILYIIEDIYIYIRYLIFYIRYVCTSPSRFTCLHFSFAMCPVHSLYGKQVYYSSCKRDIN